MTEASRIDAGDGSAIACRWDGEEGPVYGSDGLKYAMMGCLLFYVISAVMMLLGARSLDRDWVD